MTGYYDSRAEEDFNKVRTQELLGRIQNFMNPDKRRLLSLTEVKSLLRPNSEYYKGMQTVPVDLIVGSEGRYRDFDSHFLPKHGYLRSRWQSVDQANLNDTILPAITLYEIGGVYFVRDGNHRVSVAKAKGVAAIDAEVIGLASEILIRPGMTIEDLRREVLNYEKRVFYNETNFGELTDYWDLNFSSPGRFDEVYNHILGHKYFINQGKKEEISFADALVSWYQNVYRPIIDAITESRIVSRFPDRTTADLYVFIVKHWDGLKKQFGVNVRIEDAAKDFSRQFGLPLRVRIVNALSGIIRRK
jgi:hypothetical protein